MHSLADLVSTQPRAILLTYDLDRMHWEVKSAALRFGFRDYAINNAGNKVELPNTTLLVDAYSPQDAMAKFIGVVRGVNTQVVILRAATFDWSTGQAHTDQPQLSALAAFFATRPFF